MDEIHAQIINTQTHILPHTTKLHNFKRFPTKTNHKIQQFPTKNKTMATIQSITSVPEAQFFFNNTHIQCLMSAL